jgi:hypothetical protein
MLFNKGFLIKVCFRVYAAFGIVKSGLKQILRSNNWKITLPNHYLSPTLKQL